MNRWQKIAWFNLIVVSSAAVLSGIAVVVLYFKVGMPRALGGAGFMGFCGLIGLTPLLFKKKTDEVAYDERDVMIVKRAARVGFLTSYLFIVLACMITWCIIGPKGSITVNVLPWLCFGQMFAMVIVQSVVTLAGYGREVGDG